MTEPPTRLQEAPRATNSITLKVLPTAQIQSLIFSYVLWNRSLSPYHAVFYLEDPHFEAEYLLSITRTFLPIKGSRNQLVFNWTNPRRAGQHGQYGKYGIEARQISSLFLCPAGLGTLDAPASWDATTHRWRWNARGPFKQERGARPRYGAGPGAGER